MPSVPTNPAASKAGIITSETGERHIPSSTRSDGSVRKEIRVRPGYRPPEDVELYKNRTAEAWKNRGSGGVPGAAKPESGGEGMGSTAANKNAKRREARKKAAAAATSDSKASAAPIANGASSSAPAPALDKPAASEDVDKAKEARKLSKKLRQARELKDRKDQGEGLLPEQFEKVIRINELIRQLDNMGFDAEGEEKKEQQDGSPAVS